ncbi:MAG: transcriptional repressor LexA [Verrucomicrobiota bacterium]|jgi:repressor LexA
MTNRPATKKQQQVLEFIRKYGEQHGHSPTLREIANHFQVNVTAIVDHIKALRNKGLVTQGSRQARSLRLVSPLDKLRKRIVDVPVFGSIPAGFPLDRQQEAKACISVDVQTLNIKPTARTFALEVRGDSMIGKNILPGDFVICEHGIDPRNGDVVAALIDRESTLKTFVIDRGRTYLKSENPKYPKQLIPAEELVIQGVMIALIRKRTR